MKKISSVVLVCTLLGIGLGLGIGLLAAYAKAYVFEGIEEETVGIYLMVSVLIFGPVGWISGKLIEKKLR